MEHKKRKSIRLKKYDYSQNGAYFITISQIIQSFKRHSTIAYINLVKQKILPPFDKQIWQRSFYDHIIRNQNDYNEMWQYIDENPKNWNKDCLNNKNKETK